MLFFVDGILNQFKLVLHWFIKNPKQGYIKTIIVVVDLIYKHNWNLCKNCLSFPVIPLKSLDQMNFTIFFFPKHNGLFKLLVNQPFFGSTPLFYDY